MNSKIPIEAQEETTEVLKGLERRMSLLGEFESEQAEAAVLWSAHRLIQGMRIELAELRRRQRPMVRLTELDAFLFYGRSMRRVESLAEAEGVTFKCPACYLREGRHAERVQHDITLLANNPVPPRLEDSVDMRGALWAFAGLSVHDLTLDPSIRAKATGCDWHGYVLNGECKEALGDKGIKSMGGEP